MGFFDRFRKPKPQTSIYQIAYHVAYSVLPKFAYENIDALLKMFTELPQLAGHFYYTLACQAHGIKPNLTEAARFRVFFWRVREGLDFHIMEYPAPPTADDDQPVNIGDAASLSPYFSAIVVEAGVSDIRYFILGRAPLGSGTTLRTVNSSGLNSRIGIGPEPSIGNSILAVNNIVSAQA